MNQGFPRNALLLFFPLFIANSGLAQVGFTIAAFNQLTSGEFPASPLVAGSDGTLYGTTQEGTYNGAGTVFSIKPVRGQQPDPVVLYAFGSVSRDAAFPLGSISLGADGSIYGSALFGGPNGQGAVFQLTPDQSGGWSESIIYSFSGPDGAQPVGGVTLGPAGEIYGTTSTGGVGFGTVFQLKPPVTPGAGWIYSPLYHFLGTGQGDGQDPEASLVIGRDGSVYGTTVSGGSANGGTAFQLTPDAFGGWTKTTIAEFGTGAGDGATLYGNLIADLKGVLYGTTYYGGTSGQGTIFALTPPRQGSTVWSKAILYSFAGGADGANPAAGLTLSRVNGVLFGTTFNGGSANVGTIFKLTPPAAIGGQWTESVLLSNGTKPLIGGGPGASLLRMNNGILYGTTYFGGQYNSGTAFEVIP